MHNGSNMKIFDYNSLASYKCDHNFSLTGEASIHSTTKDNMNGVWNGSAPECKGCRTHGRRRRDVPPDTNGREGPDGCFRVSVKNPGQCGTLPMLSLAVPRDTSRTEGFPIGTEVTYRCLDGFVKIPGKSDTVVCLSNYKWSTIGEFCNEMECKPLELENGRVHFTDLRFGATANFSCNEGYRLIGATSAQCVVVGNGVDWDKKVPLCEGIPCLPPPDIPHGSYTGQSEQEFSFGSAVTYKCDQGFSLIGEASIHCTTKDHVNGEWSGPAPECKD
nr:complement receptor type 1-like isoform X1 [Chrysemys picta bellii]